MIPVEHPYLSAQVHFRYGRIHLPVAPRYNIRCGYRDRRYDCASESQPGVTSGVISPEVALDRMERAPCPGSRLWVAGVARPGEPLANPTTPETLRLIHTRFPRLLLCLDISGLVLSDALPKLLDCGVSTLTVTVNTYSVACAGHVYRAVGGSAGAGTMVAFLSAQQEDVAKAAEAGLTVKVNTVVIPGFNTGGIEEITCRAARAGAVVMDLILLIPQASFRDDEPPSRAPLEALRARARVHIPQFTHCRRCRTNAMGASEEMSCIGYL